MAEEKLASDIGKQVLGLIEKEQGDYSKSTGDFYPSFASGMKTVLELIDFYWVDKYRDSDTDRYGWMKPFYNVIENPSVVASKSTDIDTKDAKIIAEEGASYYPAWLCSRDFRRWMKNTEFGKILNSFIFKFPKYGSTMVKKVKGGVDLVNLRKFSCSEGSPNIKEWTFAIEEFEKTDLQMDEFKKSWENIETAKNSSGLTKIYSRFGSLSSIPELKDYNFIIISENGTILRKDKYKKITDLYRKLDWDEITGRSLGRGMVEKFFQAQIQVNRVENYKSQGLHWTAKHLFFSRDDNFKKNLMMDTENGEVLRGNSEIVPLAMEERNLHAYVEEEQRWDASIRLRGFNTDLQSGARPPAGTPLGTTQLQAYFSSGYYELKREDIGIFWKSIIVDWILPSFEEWALKEHAIMLDDFDEMELEKVRGLITKVKENEEIMTFITRNGKLPSFDEITLLKRIAKEKVNKEKELRIPKGFYKDIKKRVEVVITNEAIDLAAKASIVQTILMILAQNPTISTDPKTKNLFYGLLNYSGINPVDFGLDTDAGLDNAVSELKVGGSVASPYASSAPRVATTKAVM